MKCPTCQTENPYTAKYCNKCGTQLEASETLAPGKKRGRRKALILIAGAAIVMCVAAAIIAVLGGGEGEGGTPTAARVESVELPAQTQTLAATQPPPTSLPSDTVAAPAPTPTSGRTQAQVSRIVDGDTIEVSIDGQTYPLRYIGLDSPESDQPFGSEALEANRQLVEGKTVYLERDVSETDPYGRLLRYVYLQDGTFVNAELVRLGYAQAEEYPPDTRLQDLLSEAQEEARAAGRGLWQPTPTPLPEPAQIGIVKVFNQGMKEYVEIANQGTAAQDMSGWSVTGSKGDDLYRFESGYTLAAGATVRLHSGEDGLNQPPMDIYWSERTVWNNDGETAFLKDAQGNLIDEYTY